MSNVSPRRSAPATPDGALAASVTVVDRAIHRSGGGTSRSTRLPAARLGLLEQLAREFAGRGKLVKVNVDEAVGLRDGHEVARHVGAAPVEQLRHWTAENATTAA